MAVKAPGIVTLVGIYVWIMAAVSAVTGAALLVVRNDAATQAAYGVSGTALLWTAIIELAFALLLAATAMNLRGGSRGARTFVAILMGLRIAVTAVTVAAHPNGGMLVAGILYILVPILVLWGLYGNDKAEAYFDR